MRRPRSARKDKALELMGPRVSKAIGMNVYVLARSVYFASFLSPALSAAPPSSRDVEGRCDAARVSATVTSHMRFLPPCQGINVRPFGRQKSVLERPEGSLLEGTPARVSARQIRSLRWW